MELLSFISPVQLLTKDGCWASERFVLPKGVFLVFPDTGEMEILVSEPNLKSTDGGRATTPPADLRPRALVSVSLLSITTERESIWHTF